MSRLKILFVTHVVSLGGASRSLRELLNAYTDADADLVVPRFAGAPDDDEIRRFFGPRLGKIHREWLPWAEVYAGHPRVWQSARSHLLFPILWRAARARFERLAQNYDAVHLNSIVLHPMLSERLPFIFHVREILTDHRESVRANAARARGVVFIDEATRAPFEGQTLARSIVLNNPVDMTGVGRVPPDAQARLGGDPSSLVNFAIIGDLTDEKGLPFVVESFTKMRAPDARLLLVGRAQPAMKSRLEKLAAGDRRIIFWGPERDIAQVYTLADYVMRGEAYPCVGRTIYEALYAGCGVIVPGARESQVMFEYERFADRIRFYAPRDGDALVARLQELSTQKRSAKKGESNVAAYVADFDRFVRESIQRR